jgi:hypothetical protein
MWRFLKRLFSAVDRRRNSTARNKAFYVYRVQLPDGPRDIVSLLPHDVVFASGLASAAVVGGCTQLFDEAGSITEANFQPNRGFVDLLHDVIATEAPTLPALRAEARRQFAGWVYLIDARTPTPGGEVPPHDIIGAFEVRDGALVPRSYRPNARHRLFSSNGLFRLEPALHERLMQRLMEQAALAKSSVGQP